MLNRSSPWIYGTTFFFLKSHGDFPRYGPFKTASKWICARIYHIREVSSTCTRRREHQGLSVYYNHQGPKGGRKLGGLGRISPRSRVRRPQWQNLCGKSEGSWICRGSATSLRDRDALCAACTPQHRAVEVINLVQSQTPRSAWPVQGVSWFSWSHLTPHPLSVPLVCDGPKFS